MTPVDRSRAYIRRRSSIDAIGTILRRSDGTIIEVDRAAALRELQQTEEPEPDPHPLPPPESA